jgi:hypothetical protein
MASLDTVLTQVTNQTALTNVTVAPGDSLTVRAFRSPQQAFLDDIVLKGGQSVTGRLTSPYLHDTTRGITVLTAQAPSVETINNYASQALSSQDPMVLQALSGAANSTIAALLTYYTDLGASDARLHLFGDIAGLINQIKPVEVDVTASATIGAWNDTLITTTENLLKANTDYAVLGYIVDVACAVVAIKGQDTGNLRCGGPGSVLSFVTNTYFVDKSNTLGRPYIPVINAANVNNTFVSVADNAASTAVKVQMQLAELAQTVTP